MVTTRSKNRASPSPASAADTPATTPSRRRSAQSSSGEASTALAVKTQHFEFGGPAGALFVTLVVPFTTYALYFSCTESPKGGPDGGSCPPTPPWAFLAHMPQGVLASFLDSNAFLAYFGWYAFTVAAWWALPGRWEEGSELRTGGRKRYKINGFATLLLSVGLALLQIFVNGPENFTFIYDHWLGLVTASIIMSLLQAIYVYVASFQEGKLLALGGNSGNVLYDWFIGRELNPSIGSFDIKTFNELRPGLILWVLIDLAMACKQWVYLNGRLTDSMVLVCLFHSWYVFDALFNESAIFTQMDITTDGFGFMLAVGDLAWVPFTYSLQARFLVFHPVDNGLLGVGAILVVQAIGFYIFRTSNAEKNEFRKGKNPKNLSYMTTSTGRKLLTSGWWGRSRHPNYLGDWIMSWAWSLPTGFHTPITYFYSLYFAVLLVHRQLRDDEACRKKYGKDWDRYCEIVKYRIVPGVY